MPLILLQTSPAATQSAPAAAVTNAAAKLEAKLDQSVDRAQQLLDIARGYAVEFAPKVVGAVVVLLITWFLAGWARRILRTVMERAHIDRTLVKFLSNAARYAILVLGVLACLSTFGLNVTSFIAILSAAGLAVGLALQGTLSHLASGIMLLIFRPFKVGDLVNAGGQLGVIDTIDLFSTTMDTADNRRIIIPNGAIYGSTITNFTYHPYRLISIRVTLAGSVTPDQAREALRAAAFSVIERKLGALLEPGPKVTLAEMSGNGPVWAVTVAAETPKVDPVTEALQLAVNDVVAAGKLAPPPPVTLTRAVP